MRRASAVIAAAVVLAAVAGCSRAPAAPAPSTPSALSTTSAPGTVSGMVRLYGGPVDPTTGRQALNGEPAPSRKVAVREGSTTVASGTSDALGRFTFRLPPGAYTLVCGGEVPFAVATGQMLNLDCPVPVP